MELYFTDEDVERRKKERLISKAMELWRGNAAEYRVLPIRYFFLLSEKRAAGLPLRGLSKSELDDYPEVYFFRITEEQVARDWLKTLEMYQLRKEVERLDFVLKSDYSYVTLKSWVADSIYCLAHQRRPAVNSLIR